MSSSEQALSNMLDAMNAMSNNNSKNNVNRNSQVFLSGIFLLPGTPLSTLYVFSSFVLTKHRNFTNEETEA